MNTLDAILSTQSGAGGGGGDDTDAIVNQIADNILRDVPKPFNIKAAEKKYPVRYE